MQVFGLSSPVLQLELLINALIKQYHKSTGSGKSYVKEGILTSGSLVLII